jgi:eukaryotic-like serine/threonine-protein kinase
MRRGVVHGWPVRAEFVEQTAVSDETAVTIEEERGAAPPGPPPEPPPERELWPWLLFLLVLVLGGLAGVYFATRDDRSAQRQPTTRAVAQQTAPPTQPTTSVARESARVTVPPLVGVQAPKALKRLRQLGLRGVTNSVFSDKARNVVVAQTPPPSRKLANGETVALNVSKGPRALPVPDVVGQTLADALGTLQADRFKTRIVRVPSLEPTGHVVAQDPKAGAKAQPNVVVRLNVSADNQAGASTTPTTPPAVPTKQETGPTVSALVQVPDLEGTTLIDARRLVRKAGLVIEIKRVPNAQLLGTVVAQAKKRGTHVKRGTHMLVTVSMGQPTSTSKTPTRSESQPIAVPDVAGEDEITATQDLQNAGLAVRAIDQDTTNPSQDGLVVEQTPAANASVQPGATVTIYVGRYTGG